MEKNWNRRAKYYTPYGSYDGLVYAEFWPEELEALC